MPAPSEAFYKTSIKVSLSTSLLAILTDNWTAKIYIYSEEDLLLAEINCNSPPGTVEADGSLTITTFGPDTSANASGFATWMEFHGEDETVAITMPIQEGVTPTAGYLVMTSATIIAGEPVAVTGFTIG